MDALGGSMTSKTAATYDEMPYSALPYGHTHPSRLAAVATLAGLSPPSVERCRVLELGCGAGGNLAPMAQESPHATFVGIDLSQRQIDDGKTLVAELGLTNLDLRHLSITDIDESLGTFDYIICHGVYSWVPDSVREKILDVCRDLLDSQGVAYISFNTYPGWHMRGMVCDLMRFHARQFTDATEQVRQARAFLQFAAQSAEKDSVYSTLLKFEQELISQASDTYLFHEHLEADNRPVYFHEFAEYAADHGLQYLGEAKPSPIRFAIGDEARQMLDQLADDAVRHEQYLDFLLGGVFRHSLLCHADAKLDWEGAPQRIGACAISALAEPIGPLTDVTSQEEVQFRVTGDATGKTVLSTCQPLIKAVLSVLERTYPAAIDSEPLRTDVAGLLGNPIRDVDWHNAIWQSYQRTLLDLRVCPPRFGPVSEKPMTSPLARLLVIRGEEAITNRWHRSTHPEAFERLVLALADGTHDRQALIDKLDELSRSGAFTVCNESGASIDDGLSRRSVLAQELNRANSNSPACVTDAVNLAVHFGTFLPRTGPQPQNVATTPRRCETCYPGFVSPNSIPKWRSTESRRLFGMCLRCRNTIASAK